MRNGAALDQTPIWLVFFIIAFGLFTRRRRQRVTPNNSISLLQAVTESSLPSAAPL